MAADFLLVDNLEQLWTARFFVYIRMPARNRGMRANECSVSAIPCKPTPCHSAVQCPDPTQGGMHTTGRSLETASI